MARTRVIPRRSTIENRLFVSKNTFGLQLPDSNQTSLLTLKDVTLPFEIVDFIANFADVPSIIQLSQCNKMLYKVFGNENYWRAYLDKHFGFKEPETGTDLISAFKKFAIVLHSQMSMYLDGLKAQVLQKQIISSQGITDVRFTLPRSFICFFTDQISRLCSQDLKDKSLSDNLLPLNWVQDGDDYEFLRNLKLDSRIEKYYQEMVEEEDVDNFGDEDRYSFVAHIAKKDSVLLGEPIVWIGNTGIEEDTEYTGFLVDFSTLVPTAQSGTLSIDLQEAKVVVSGYNSREYCPLIHIAHTSFSTFVAFSSRSWGPVVFFDRHGLPTPQQNTQMDQDEDSYPYSDFLKQYLQRRKQFLPQTVTEEEEKGEEEEDEHEHVQPLKKQRME